MSVKYSFELLERCTGVEQIAVFGTGYSDDDNLGLWLTEENFDSLNPKVGQLVLFHIDTDPFPIEAEIIEIDPVLHFVTLGFFYDGSSSITVDWVAQFNRQAIHPGNFTEGLFVWTRLEHQMMRLNYEGKLKLSGSEYSLIKNAIGADCCCYFILEVYKNCNATKSLFYRGLFGLPEITDNAERCTLEFEMQPFDLYRCLMEGLEQDVNVLNIANKQSITINYNNVFEFSEYCEDNVAWAYGFTTFTCGQVPLDVNDGYFVPNGPPPPVTVNNCITGGQGWTPYKVVYQTVLGGGGTLVNCKTKWFREVRVTTDVAGVANPPPGDGWIDIGAGPNILGQPTHKFARPPFNGYYTNWDSFAGDDGVGCGDGISSLVLSLPGSTITYDRGRSLDDVLNYVALNTCRLLKGVQSDFFEINAPGDAPDYSAGNNYVTMGSNKVNDLVLLQKTDFLTPDSSSAASKAPITWKKLISDLATIFNLGWNITPNGYIRIEHLKFYENTQLSNQIDLSVESSNKGKRVFTYDKSAMPQKETWGWMDVVSDDFKGLSILYLPVCTDKNQPESIQQVDNFTTDVDFMQAAPGDISSDGFVLLARDGSGGCYQETSPISSLLMNNGHLAYCTLQPNYFKWGRVLGSGFINGVQITFDSAKRRRELKNQVLYDCCSDFDFNTSYANTEAGSCRIERVQLSPKNNKYTFDLKTDDNC